MPTSKLRSERPRNPEFWTERRNASGKMSGVGCAANGLYTPVTKYAKAVATIGIPTNDDIGAMPHGSRTALNRTMTAFAAGRRIAMTYSIPLSGVQLGQPGTNYPVPVNETQRLRALQDLMILDTPPDSDLDALVKLACEIFNVPISIISLIDRDRQWFKAVAGLEFSETKRAVAICNFAIAGGQPFVVKDALRDPRFASNPLVTGRPDIRFYAGVPLALSPGVNVGTLCIIDRQPGEIDDDGLRRLKFLGEIAVALLRLHKTTRQADTRSEEIARQTDVIAAQAKMLHSQKDLLDRASSLAKLGAWEFDLRTGKVSWSEGMYALHDVDRSYDIQFDKLLEFYPQPGRDRLLAAMERSRKESSSYHFEGRMFTAKGRLRWVRVIGDVEVRDGKPVRRFGLWQDITDEKVLLDQVNEVARRDELTGLLNRKALSGALAEISGAPKPRKSVAVLIFDIDNFKEVNDTHGHAAGDACLRHVARRIQIAVGDDGIIARIGGDEFAVLLHGNLSDSPGIVADRIGSSVGMPFQWSGHSFHCTTSIGIAVRDKEADIEPDDLIREADLALYDAKAAGRNCHRTYRPALQAASKHRYETVRDVRRALLMRHLELYYQPKVALADASHRGFEALLRWHKSAQVVLAPGAFLAALDDPILSKDIGDYVIASAINQAKAWKGASVPFGHIAVNLSASQFRNPELAAEMLRAMDIHGIDRGMIEVEVTENVFLSTSSNSVLHACQSFKAGGIRIAFDDFGTGFASLSHLRDFPVDTIKIDRSFISQLGRGENTTAIVNAMVSLAHNLSMQIVAEGVEEESQREFLRAIGCDQAQGYLFGRPEPAVIAVRHLMKMRQAQTSIEAERA
jgi:diguanylate cyclase (GGDEF)-like protein